MEGIMAEVVANTGVTKEAGYFYYLGKDGNVWRTKMASGGKQVAELRKLQMQMFPENQDTYITSTEAETFPDHKWLGKNKPFLTILNI